MQLILSVKAFLGVAKIRSPSERQKANRL